MSLNKNLPKVKNFTRPEDYKWDAPSDALGIWAEQPMASDSEDDSVISIFDVIGEDWWSGGGWTSDRLGRALKRAKGNAITVQINSPGGDMFEGITMFNQLAAYDARVTVEIYGIAASAASIIAMAGDDIVMGLGSQMMVHSAWGLGIGNQFDFAELAEIFQAFDKSLVEIYEARTGRSQQEIEDVVFKNRGGGTFMSGQEAIDQKFADRKDDKLKVASEPENKTSRSVMARRKTEAALASQGVTRSDRSSIIDELIPAAPRDASRPPAARDAGEKLLGDVQEFINSLK